MASNESFESSSEMFFQDGDVEFPHGSGVQPVEVLQNLGVHRSQLTHFFSLQNHFELLSCEKERVVSRLQNVVPLELETALLHHQIQSPVHYRKNLFLVTF